MHYSWSDHYQYYCYLCIEMDVFTGQRLEIEVVDVVSRPLPPA